MFAHSGLLWRVVRAYIQSDSPEDEVRCLRLASYYHFVGFSSAIIIFRVSCRRREMYIGHARLSVCLCVSVCLSAATSYYGRPME